MRNLCAVLFTAAALLVGATSANAQSEIFFSVFNAPLNGGWVMGPNGEGKTQTVAGEPSYFKHAGQRWFLAVIRDEESYGKLYAVCEDGRSTQLTFFDKTVQVRNARWAKDDSKIAFNTWTYEPDGSSPAHIYLANVQFTNGIPELTSDFEPVVGPAGIRDSFDLSPDSSQVVYAVGTSVMIKTIGGATVQIMSGAHSPRWSHNGQRIAIRSEDLGVVGTVRTDGSGLVKLAKDTDWAFPTEPRWAPDDSALIYGMNTRKTGVINKDIFRVSASGGKAKNLTLGMDSYLYPAAWRSTINVD